MPVFTRMPPPRGAILYTLMFLLIGGAPGCGESEGQGQAAQSDSSGARYVSASQAAQIAADENSVGVRGGDRARIAEVLADVQVDYAAGFTSVCNELTEHGRREVATSTGAGECERGLERIFAANESAGKRGKLSEIVGIDVHGDRAMASIRDPGPGAPYPVRFAQDAGGVWRLTSLAQVESEAMEAAR